MSDGWDDWGGSSTTPAATTTPTGNSSSGGGSGWGSSETWGGTSSTQGGGGGGGSKPSFGTGRRESNGGNSGRNNGSSWAPKTGWGTPAVGTVGPGGRHKISTPSMIIVDKMSSDTSVMDIRSAFGRYGKITRIVLDYQFDEDKLYCWLDYEVQDSVDKAVKLVRRIKNRDVEVKVNNYKPGESSGSGFGGDSGWASKPSGGGGGGPRTCFKCNQEGHIHRDCPKFQGRSGGSGSSGSKVCYKCGEEGHMSRDCSTGGNGGRGGRSYEKKPYDRPSGGGGWGSSNDISPWGTSSDSINTAQKEETTHGSSSTTTTSTTPTAISTAEDDDGWG